MSLSEVDWELPHSTPQDPSAIAIQALEFAQTAAQDFDNAFFLRNPDRERSIPTFDGEEVVIAADPIRFASYTAEHELRTVRIVADLQRGSFGPASQARSRFADRSIDGHYAVKYLQAGLIDSDHASNGATEMILETKILMNLAPHPNISQAYGVNAAGIDSFLVQGRKGFFIITDRIAQTLVERIQLWRDRESTLPKSSHSSEKSKSPRERLNERLEIAMDIASALLYLHDRKLVYYLRPDKVGFDTRYGRIKLCQFGQARQQGMITHARSLTKSDNIRTLAYTAPEVFCKGPTTTATDVYAFGILLWEFMSLSHPFDGWDRAMHFQKVVRQDKRPDMRDPKTVGTSWPDPICELAQNCWDPFLRPSMKTVHESLEMALLFEENEEDKVKEDFRNARRMSYAARMNDVESTTGDRTGLLERSRSTREGLGNERKMRRKSLDATGGAASSPQTRRGTSVERSFLTPSVGKSFATPQQPVDDKMWASPAASETIPRNKKSPGDSATRKARKASTSRGSGRSSSDERGRSSGDETPSGPRRRSRKTSLRISEETVVALNALLQDGKAQGKRINVRNYGMDIEDPELPQILTKLGFQMDEEGYVRAAQPPPPAPRSPTKTPERRHRKSVEDHSDSHASGSHSTPRTRARRRSSIDGGEAAAASSSSKRSASSAKKRTGTPGRRQSDSEVSGSESSPSKSNRLAHRKSMSTTPGKSRGDRPKHGSPVTRKSLRNMRRSDSDDSKIVSPQLGVDRTSSDEKSLNDLFSESVLAGFVGNVRVPSNKSKV